jgi:hypothetical protein
MEEEMAAAIETIEDLANAECDLLRFGIALWCDFVPARNKMRAWISLVDMPPEES